MGKQKRKTNSPLLKDDGKNPRLSAEPKDNVGDDVEEGSVQGDDADVISDLKKFIRTENARNNKCLAEEMRRHNDERMRALENSLSFALTTNETLAKRLSDVEKRAENAEKELMQCAKRMADAERQLEEMQQRELHSWLIFSGPAVSRARGSSGREDTAHLLHDMVRRLMEYDMDMRQIAELHRDERQIKVRFSTVAAGSARHYLVRNKTKLRGSGLFIRERLTPARQRMFNDLLQLKRASQITNVFTREGTVFVVVDQRDRPRPVRSEAAMERLLHFLSERASSRQTETRHTTERRPEETDAPSILTQESVPEIEGAEVQGRSARSGSVEQRSPAQLEARSSDEGRTEPMSDQSVDRSGTTEDAATRRGPESSPPDSETPASGRPTGGGVSEEGDGTRSPQGRRAGGGGSQGVVADTASPAVRLVARRRRGATSSTGARGYGGDIRSYVMRHEKHSKSD